MKMMYRRKPSGCFVTIDKHDFNDYMLEMMDHGSIVAKNLGLSFKNHI